ncbi:MAG: phosphoribosyltransferase [Thermoanaerobacterales bacterium]|nr:phosphoribosyltransferase [Thermoanaerobacterales bacterium]
MFRDRVDAGRRLLAALKGREYPRGLVLAVPRGGVVVGAEVARGLGLPLDIIIPRKIGAPHNPEMAVGAVTQDGTAIYDEHLLVLLGLTPDSLAPKVREQVREIERRSALYRGGRPPVPWEGRTVILVDDGVATGYTTLAALRSLRRANPRRIILAVPVAPPETVARLRDEVDELVCLLAPEPFYAVGQFYREFDQTDDQTVIDLMRESVPEVKGEK